MKKLLLSISAMMLAFGAQAQISQITDIHIGAGDSDPCMILGLGGSLVFNADDGINGRELWSYDTLTSTLNFVYNIAPGAAGSQAPSFASNNGTGIVFNGKLYFTANDGTNGAELWVYDGVAAPSMLVDIDPGPANGNPQNYIVLDGKIYFTASNGIVGMELFMFDPATNIVQAVADVNPGALDGGAEAAIVFNNKIYFSGYEPTLGSELYAYDPATNTTVLVHDINPGAGHSNPSSATVINGKLYFVGYTATHGQELYSYSGVGAPIRITDLNPGVADGFFTGRKFTPVLFNNRIFFNGDNDVLGFELYALDPSNNTTSLVSDIAPGGSGSTPACLTVYANALYFTAATPSEGNELWKYDGVSPPAMVMDLNPGSGSSLPLVLTVIGNKLYFNAQNATEGFELYEYYDAAVSVKKVGVDMNIEVFPVPAIAEAHLRISSGRVLSFATSVYDMSGKVVFSIPATDYAAGTNSITIPMQALAAGNYQYKLTAKDGSMLGTGRIVKQ